MTPPTIRQTLRDATAALHDRLDRAMGRLDLMRTDDYATFLAIQAAARRPIEAWIDGRRSEHPAPPPQSPAIMRDLAECDHRPDLPEARFTLPEGSDPLGLYWLLAGSVMGNRAMLADLRKRGIADCPTEFLESRAMLDYWRTIRPVVEAPVPPTGCDASVIAARAGFEHFLGIEVAFREEAQP